MVGGLLKKLFGTKNEREIKRLLPLVEQINSLEPKISILSDSQLKDKTPEFKKRLELGETLDDILPRGICCCKGSLKKDA